jgi:hypothetical protein
MKEQNNYYYNRIIAGLPSEEALQEFLNKPDIMAKFTTKELEEFAERWLMDHGFDEVDAAPVGVEAIVMSVEQ